MNTKLRTYILCANQKAMALYKLSKETLMTSTSYDFMVFGFSKWEDVIEDMEEWEDFVAIDETTYHELHANLCVKLRALIRYF
ncbi:hypothetical protein [uncultured Algibacter sp.]|uniref:hypothetical protein n=1 Tax=uncultured Algibacter sp. TaxID=298659 RepID=UPI002628523C|nr:hypothetical protein [uncultured Algibacter sp.]